MSGTRAPTRDLADQAAALPGVSSNSARSTPQPGTATSDRARVGGPTCYEGCADEATRPRLAETAETSPAADAPGRASVLLTERAASAMTRSATFPAETLPAEKADERLRVVLGRKLAFLMPGLAESDREGMQQWALKSLHALVEHEAVRVRATIAAAICDMPDVPHSVVLLLACDDAVSVHDPVIHLSPLLSAGDILGLLSQPEPQLEAAAIARRPGLDAPGLGPTVPKAIAHSTADAAIRALLENGSAAVREATLDSLISRAEGREASHQPFARRPGLTEKAAQVLTEIVTTHLLTVLVTRGNLSAALTSAVKRRLHERTAGEAPQRPPQQTIAEAMADARVLFEEGQLSEKRVLEAAGHGQRAMALAMLAVAANVAPAAVERAIILRNGKGLVSLAWKAGFSMRFAVAIQTLLTQVAPGSVLRATGSGGYPLCAEEMKYQLELLVRAGG